MDDAVIRPASELSLVDTGFSREATARGVNATAAMVDAKVRIEAAYVAAWTHPRDIGNFRVAIQRFCIDPAFAADSLYHKPVGREQDENGKWQNKVVTNFSIRFMEAAIPLYKHLHTTATVHSNNVEDLTLTVHMLDAEGSSSESRQALIKKTIERKPNNIRDREVIATRKNTKNEEVCIVAATVDELRNLIGAERSKLKRDLAQTFMPYHILRECRRLIEATIEKEEKTDPRAAVNRLMDRFAGLGVMPSEVAEYIGKPLDALDEKDRAELRVIYSQLQEGEFKWADLVHMKDTPAENEPPEKAEARSKLKDRIMASRKQAGKPPKGQPEPPKDAA
jgi:hypothetical protein